MLDQFFPLYLEIGLITLIVFSLLWVLSLFLKNSSIVDIFWGFGFVVIAWITFFLTPQGFLPRKMLLLTLVTLWGLRLSIHILLRNWGKPEDFRYQKWRQENGARWGWLSYFKVFLLQGLLQWLIAAPLVATQVSPQPSSLTVFDFIALFLWIIGFSFEAGGDWQLTQFIKHPENKDKILDSGFWRYTRHPNYFGDAAQWWAYTLLAITAGGLWTILSPIIMTVLLRNVSGVALLERSMVERKPAYKEYMQTTNAFIPWFPRKKKSSGG